MSTDPQLISQHKLRQYALQALYLLEFREDDKLTNATALEIVLDGQEIQAKNLEFLQGLVEGVLAHEAEINKRISRHLMTDWTLSRLTSIDRAILRLGSYEMLYTEIDQLIALDESLNLAKDFSDESSTSLINGVLQNLLKS